MKIKICAALSAALMLTACGSDNELTYISDTSETMVSESETTSESHSEALTETSETESKTASEVTSVASETSAATADEQAADYRETYKAKLLEVLNSEDAITPAFDLFDMNGDGIPELFISYGDVHAMGVFAYTFADGVLCDLSEDNSAFGSYGLADVSSDGHLKSEYSGMGITYDSFYRFEGNALKCVLTAEKGEEPVPADDDTYNFETYYKTNGTDVSEIEYDTLFSEENDRDWVTVGRGNIIDDKSIEAVLFAE